MSTKKLFEKFQQIYDETYNNILKYITCKCNNLDDIDDIIQETYLELYKIIKEKKKIIDYKSYITIIAKNKIIKYSNSNCKLKTISLFQEEDNDEYIINLDSRYRYRIRIYYKR